MIIVSIIITLIAFLILDVIWISIFAKKEYLHTLSHLLAINPDGKLQLSIAPAILFYICILFGIWYFAIYPNLNNSWYKAAINGGLIGLITYGTYAFTCQSLFKGWTWPITITDVIWGIVICAIVSVIGRAIQVAIG